MASAPSMVTLAATSESARSVCVAVTTTVSSNSSTGSSMLSRTSCPPATVTGDVSGANASRVTVNA